MKKADMLTELYNVAATMLRPGVFLSPFREDHPARTPARIIKAAQAQQEQLGELAFRIAKVAHSLRDTMEAE